MKACLLDTSFLIDLEEEAAAGEEGPATRLLTRLGAARLYLSPVTVAELLEGAEDAAGTARALAGYRQLTIGWAAARRCALNQSRAAQRLGENDAWQAALAMAGSMTLVGHDRGFRRPAGLAYLDHRKG